MNNNFPLFLKVLISAISIWGIILSLLVQYRVFSVVTFTVPMIVLSISFFFCINMMLYSSLELFLLCWFNITISERIFK